MSEFNIEDVEILLHKLCVLMATPCEAPGDLKKRYQLLLKVVSLAIWKKCALTDTINQYETSADSFIQKARDGVNRGLHYEERRLYALLAEPEGLQGARRSLDKVEIILEGTRRFENILKAYYEVMRLDLKLSFEGHE